MIQLVQMSEFNDCAHGLIENETKELKVLNKNTMSQPEIILEAALKCISEKGYAKVSLRQIADEAGVVLSQLNYYYKNKQGLFEEVVKTTVERYIQDVQNSLKAKDSPAERTQSLIDYFQYLLTDKPEHLKVLFDFMSLCMWDSTYMSTFKNLYEELTNMIEDFIIKDINADVLENYSSRNLARMVIGSIFGIALQFLITEDKQQAFDTFETIKILHAL